MDKAIPGAVTLRAPEEGQDVAFRADLGSLGHEGGPEGTAADLLAH